MTATVIALYGGCVQCRATLGPPREDEFMVTAGTNDHRRLCSECFDACVEEVAENRRIFDALIAMGVSNEDANRMMFAKLRLQ